MQTGDEGYVLQSLFKVKKLTEHQITSYDAFIKNIKEIQRQRDNGILTFIPTIIKQEIEKRVDVLKKSPLVTKDDFPQKKYPTSESEFEHFKITKVSYRDHQMDILLNKQLVNVIRSFPSYENLKLQEPESQNGEYENFEDFEQKLIQRVKKLQEQLQYTVFISDFVFEFPQIKDSQGKMKDMFPYDCLTKQCTYAAAMHIVVNIQSPTKEEPINMKFHLCDIPVMVYSCLCNLRKLSSKEELIKHHQDPLDEGGYFIIASKPTEPVQRKVMVAKENLVNTNFIIAPGSSSTSPIKWYAKMYSLSETNSSTSRINITYHHKTARSKMKHETFIFSFETHTKIKVEIPVKYLFMALGVTNTVDMIKILSMDMDVEQSTNKKLIDLLIPTVEFTDTEYKHPVLTQDDAIIYIAKLSTTSHVDTKEMFEKTKKLINLQVYPHAGVDFTKEVNIKKAYYLGYQIYHLCQVHFGNELPTDYDNYMNTKLDLSGKQMLFKFSKVYKESMNKVKENTQKSLDKNMFNFTISNEIKNIFTTAMRDAITSNKWNETKDDGDDDEKDISQVFESSNFLQSRHSTRKTKKGGISKAQQLVSIREVHPSIWGIVSSFDTPEGASVGINKNLCLTTLLSIENNSYVIKNFIRNYKSPSGAQIINILPDAVFSDVKLFINGDWFATVDKDFSLEFLEILRQQKKSGAFYFDISISTKLKKTEIHIYTDGGRMCRPLFVVKNGDVLVTDQDIQNIKKGKLDFNDLVFQGKIEYVDKHEEDGEDYRCEFGLAYLRSKPDNIRKKITHCEIHCEMLKAVSETIIPFASCNQAARNVYQCSMGKQAIGVPAHNYLDNLSTTQNILIYPQQPIVTTRSAKFIHIDKLPSGQNAMFLIAPFIGFTQEDSILINKSSCEFGFQTVLHYKMYHCTIKAIDDQFLMFPTKATVNNFNPDIHNTSKLDENGVVKLGSTVVSGDVLIGRCKKDTVKASLRNPNRKEFTNDCVIYNEKIKGIVDRIEIGIDAEGQPYIKVIVSQFRPLGVIDDGYITGGDKMASRYAQKGTVGTLVPSWELPYSENGHVPDLVMSPYGYPSRMTIGQLLESITNKLILQSSKLHQIRLQDVDFKVDKSHVTSKYLGENRVDSTDYTYFSIDDIIAEIDRCGVDGFGKEIFFNPKTGEKMHCLMFYGCVFYQRLKHMVVDKVHGRADGDMDVLTQQPQHKPGKRGGLRVGWMEVNSMGASGCSYMLQDRFYDTSDKYAMWVCNKCGLQAIQKIDKSGAFCNVCKQGECSPVKIPFSLRLIKNYFETANHFMRIIPSKQKSNIPH